MLTKTKAIVLHSVKYGESQLIIDLFTEQQGRLSFISHIPKTAKAKVKKQFFQPLTLLDVEFDFRQRVRLQHFKDIRVSEPFTDISFNPFKTSISLFLSEFLYHGTKDELRNVPLFNYIWNSVLWLDGSGRSYANFHLVFMMRLTRFIGFFPNLDDQGDGMFFNLRSGCFTRIIPSHPDFLAPDEAVYIQSLMRLNFETMHLFEMSHEQRNRCVEVILEYYRIHVPAFPPLKSLPVLKELFA